MKTKPSLIVVFVLTYSGTLFAENWVYMGDYPWGWSNERQSWVCFTEPSLAIWDYSNECWAYLGQSDFNWKTDIPREFRIFSEELQGTITLSDTRSGFFGEIQIDSISETLSSQLANESIQPSYQSIFEFKRESFCDGFLILNTEDFTLLFDLAFENSLDGRFECSVLSRIVDFPIPYRFVGSFDTAEQTQ